MSLMSFIIKTAVPAPKAEAFGRYLFVGPHPDDIEIGAGATAAKLAAAGKAVSFLICLDGRFGFENLTEKISPDELAALRKEESIRAAAALGVTDVRFLGLSDGGLYDPEELKKGIARVIGEVQPDIVFAPDPAVPNECHTDHLNVGEAVRRLAFFAPFEDIMGSYGAKSAPVEAAAFYMTARPNRFVKTSGFREKQFEAILCHESQFPKDSDAFNEVARYLKIRESVYGLQHFKGKAEGFRILGRTQMHCLPEVGL